MGGVVSDLAYIWASYAGDYVKTVNGVDFFVYRDLAKWDRIHPDKLAYSLGDCVMCRSLEDLTPDIERHELKHAEQISRVGGFGLFLPCYLWEELCARVAKRENKYETEAIDAE